MKNEKLGFRGQRSAWNTKNQLHENSRGVGGKRDSLMRESESGDKRHIVYFRNSVIIKILH